jgi:hypothetical protein
MNALLLIEGTHPHKEPACLYRGVYDAGNELDFWLYKELIRHFKTRGWIIHITLMYTVEGA